MSVVLPGLILLPVALAALPSFAQNTAAPTMPERSLGTAPRSVATYSTAFRGLIWTETKPLPSLPQAIQDILG
ncbi:MAG TPA: hypothetical protein V6D18_03615 [Thermosynechococcaceae cyanobacterium]